MTRRFLGQPGSGLACNRREHISAPALARRVYRTAPWQQLDAHTLEWCIDWPCGHYNTIHPSCVTFKGQPVYIQLGVTLMTSFVLTATAVVSSKFAP